MFPTMWSSLDKSKTPTSDEIKKIPSFVFCKWLTGNPKTIFDANDFNRFYDIPIENQYFCIKYKHAGKIRNIKYVKSEKDDNPDVDLISNHFKMSIQEAKQYLELMNQNELKYIKDLYKPK